MTSRGIAIRAADESYAKRLHALIAANREEGHLLPRTLEEITRHADRFLMGVRNRKVVGCAELAPLSANVAEVRSLAVDRSERGSHVGTELVEELKRRARRHGFDKLCAFTHVPGYFIAMGFSIVPHLWVPEKVFADCVSCPMFRQCGQFAMVVSLDEAADRSHSAWEQGHGTFADRHA